jgi:hypothetical protein
MKDVMKSALIWVKTCDAKLGSDEHPFTNWFGCGLEETGFIAISWNISGTRKRIY